MAPSNELNASPDGTVHDTACVDAHDIRTIEERVDHTNTRDEENSPSIDAAGVSASDDLILTTPRAIRHDGGARILRAMLKPLIAVVTAQYAIVTALAVSAALFIASEAGKSINAKLEPIVTALKRL